MSKTTRRSTPALSRMLRRMVAVSFVAALVCAASGASALGNSTVTFGQISGAPAPACSAESTCTGIVRSTGFQMSYGQTRNPFVVRTAGTIKSWTVTLGQPSESAVVWFGRNFGSPPEARLAILRHVPQANPPRYELRGQSAVEVLTPYFGSTAAFDASLTVEKGDVVAITVPTWAPILAEGPDRDVWRASHSADEACRVRPRPPQQVIGSKLPYACTYSARVLYTATMVEGGGRSQAVLTVKPFQMYIAGRSHGHQIQLHKIVVFNLRRGNEVSLKCLHCQGGPGSARRRASSPRLVFPTRLRVDGGATLQVSVSARNGSKRVKLYGFRVRDGETRLKKQRCFAGGRAVPCNSTG